jgi:hypothetical protein
MSCAAEPELATITAASRYALSAHPSVVEEIVRSSAMALTAVLIAVVFTAIRNGARHAVTSAPQGCGGDTNVAADNA